MFQALLASCAVAGCARKDEHDFLSHSTERARLMEEIRILKSERETSENLRFTLKSENELLNGKVLEQEEIISKMQERISLAKVFLRIFEVW